MNKKIIKNILAIALTMTALMSNTPMTASAVEEMQRVNDGIVSMPNNFKKTIIRTPFRMGVEPKYDPRGINTSKVKNQAKLGTCWAFAAIANLEHHLISTGESESDFSEEHLRWWATKDSNGIGWQRKSYAGGNELMSSGYFASWSGPKLDDEIPYYHYNVGKKPGNFNIAKTQKNVTDMVFVNEDKTTVKNAIKKYGCVETGYCHIDEDFNPDTNGYYCNRENLMPNHEVLIVGWDDNYSKDNFINKSSKNGAWLVKNSWGTNWGDEGYFWVSYEDKNFLSSKCNLNISFAGVQDVKENQKVYQYDPYGVTDKYKDGTSSKLGFANVYDFSEGYNQLDGVMFMTETDGAAYEVSYAPYTNNTIDLSNKKVLKTGTVNHSGYTTVKTDAFNLPIGKGAIIVTLDASKANIPVTLGDEESFQGIYTAEANKGESFIIKDDKITDLNESGTNPRSLSVKAITTKTGNTSKIDPKPDPVVSSNTKLSKIVLGKHDVSNWLEDDQMLYIVDEHITSMDLTLQTEDSNAKIVSVNGEQVGSSSYKETVKLNVDIDVASIPIVVKASDGTETTYTIYILMN